MSARGGGRRGGLGRLGRVRWVVSSAAGGGVFANLPTFRLSGFSTCWKVGKLAGCGSGRDVLAALGTGGLPRGKTASASGRDGEEVARRIQAGAGGASAGWVAEV